MTHPFALAFLLTVLLVAGVARGAAPADGPRRIDFRYAPPQWQTSICLPDDPQKTLVGQDGALLYDFGGKFAGFKTRIAVGLAEAPSGAPGRMKQELVSPRVPIVRTTQRPGDIEITQEAFAVAPLLPPEPAPAEPARFPAPPVIERLGGTQTNQNWAAPTVACEEAFRHIAVGMNEPVRYRLRALRGAGGPQQRYTVVFGLCEGWHRQPGQRVLDLRIEGKTVQTIDLSAAKGRNVPVLLPFEARDEDGDGWIDITVAAAKGSPDTNTILNVLWVFAGQAPPVAELLTGEGKAAGAALAHVACGGEVDVPVPGAPRHDVILTHFRNPGAAAARVTPTLTIQSESVITPDAAGRCVRIGGATSVFCPGPFEVAEQGPSKLVLKFAAQDVSAGGDQTFALGVGRGRRAVRAPKDAAEALDLRAKAEDYWQHLDLPYDHITVPDPGLQALLDSSIRNIYQAREIKDGLPAFQVGPTCYRGLWVVDGSFLMEAVTLLGRGAEARNGIRYLLQRQRPDGGFMLIDGHWKETGIVLWAVSRHARLTGDQAWLTEVWPSVERGFAYLQRLRTTAAVDASAPNYRLIPAGFSDGGLGNKEPEYTNIYWNLAGMKAAVASARWLGKSQQADAWQKEYDDFLATFRKAAARDMKSDAHGNRCLPIYMIDGLKVPPQKAQWAFLHAVFPGQVFAPDDPLVTGNMAMLRAAECEGLVRDTGWVKNGVWNYFGSFYGHAWLWLGDREHAIDTLYAFGNHASPLLVWREEQMPQGEGNANCGDMPHNWASAEFIRLTRNLLVLERGNELHLCEGLPRQWLRPGAGAGAVTRLREIATEFGPISLELRPAADGAAVSLHVDPPTRNAPQRLVLHLDGWAAAQGTVELPVDRPSDRTVPLAPETPAGGQAGPRSIPR